MSTTKRTRIDIENCKWAMVQSRTMAGGRGLQRPVQDLTHVSWTCLECGEEYPLARVGEGTVTLGLGVVKLDCRGCDCSDSHPITSLKR